MSTEKFFEYAGRPVEWSIGPSSSKRNPNRWPRATLSAHYPAQPLLHLETKNKALHNDDHTYLDRRMVRRHHLQHLSVQHARLQVPVSLIAFHLGFAVRALQPTSMFLHAI
jgi:hypothetical protein